MPIIAGRINTDELESTQAEFSDGFKTTADYPDGYEFVLTSVAFNKDEQSGDIVLSPSADTFIEVYSLSDDIDTEPGYDVISRAECQAKLGVSIFALVDLLWERKRDAINDLVYAALASRNYTVRE